MASSDRRIASGERRHCVTVQRPEEPLATGDGGFTQTWTDLVPDECVAILTDASDLERRIAGTVSAVATHLVVMNYRPDVDTHCRIKFGSRFFNIGGVSNWQERNIELRLACTEALD